MSWDREARLCMAAGRCLEWWWCYDCGMCSCDCRCREFFFRDEYGQGAGLRRTATLKPREEFL